MYDDNYSLKRFISRYRGLFDMGLIKKDFAAYKSRQSVTDIWCKEIDFEKNILVICPFDIAREVFINGFSKLDDYKSYCMYNIDEIHSITFGAREEGKNVSGEESLNSEFDILQDVLCMTVSYYERKVISHEDLLINIVMSRHNKNKLNWVFAIGDETSITKEYPKMVRLFKSGGIMFDMIDLTKKASGQGGKILSKLCYSFRDVVPMKNNIDY